MEFTTATDYDMKTLTAMAKALRKTVRKGKAAAPISLDGSWSFWEPFFSFLRRAAPFPSAERRSLLWRPFSPSS